MDLRELGADHSVFGAFQSYIERGLAPARVAMAQRDVYRLLGEEEWTAEAAGKLWYEGVMPAVGDWVAARVVGDGEALIEAVLPRRTLFARRAAGKREERQAIAANIDLVFLVNGLDGDFNPRRIERYLALTAASGAAAVIVLNKADCCADLDGAVAAAEAVSGGAPVVALSARESAETLRRWVTAGRTVALLGSSGVGKSTIVNALVGEERLRTGAVREWDARGRHTTTRRELMVLPGGGVLIDTPGMRELQLWAGEDAVESAFEDIAALAEGCRFRDCSHSGEPGCAVEGAADAERLASYRKLLREARHHGEEGKRLAKAEGKRRSKMIRKMTR